MTEEYRHCDPEECKDHHMNPSPEGHRITYCNYSKPYKKVETNDSCIHNLSFLEIKAEQSLPKCTTPTFLFHSAASYDSFEGLLKSIETKKH